MFSGGQKCQNKHDKKEEECDEKSCSCSPFILLFYSAVDVHELGHIASTKNWSHLCDISSVNWVGVSRIQIATNLRADFIPINYSFLSPSMNEIGLKPQTRVAKGGFASASSKPWQL